MTAPRHRRLAFTGPPSRLPDQGPVDVEPVAGDLQLGSLRGPESKRLKEDKRIYVPNGPVPVSGVYDVVDEEGRYLRSQVTCHEGWKFPPSRNPLALEAEERARSDWERRREAVDGGEDEPPHGYGYRLAYEAQHLQSQQRERSLVIYRPGDIVPASGVYNVVDLDGEYLQCQRAFVKDTRERRMSLDGDPLERKPHRFLETEGLGSIEYGYMLAYEAEHLSHE